MAMSVGSGGDEDEVNASINTTPLVDVMLVLLIIFLITIPVVTHTIPVELPKEKNVASQTKPEEIDISVNHEGESTGERNWSPTAKRCFSASRRSRC